MAFPEYTWTVRYAADTFADTVTAAYVEIDEVSYELHNAAGDIVWSAPTGVIRCVTRGAAVPVEPAPPA